MTARDEFMEVDGARLRIRVAGQGSPLLLVHGWALDLDMWTPQLVALAARYRVVTFDRRGFGSSTGQPAIERDVDDLATLTATLGIERCAVLGMSQGARVALRWALRHPGRTWALVLDGPPPGLVAQAAAHRQEIPLDHYRELLRREGVEAVRRAWLAHPLMQLHTVDARRRALLHRIIARYPAGDLSAHAPGMPLPRADLRDLQVPTLVINGARDSAARRAAGAELARLLPNARSVAIAGAGHLSNLDRPGAYNRTVIEFLAGQPLGAPNFHGSEHRRAGHAE